MELIYLFALFLGVVGLPVVDKGVFVITGVKTCGDLSGYCILGGDCTVDKEFVPDESGHCDGLRKAFTPRAFFVCCRLLVGGGETPPPETPSTTPTPTPPHPQSLESTETLDDDSKPNSSASKESEEDLDIPMTTEALTSEIDLTTSSTSEIPVVTSVAMTTETVSMTTEVVTKATDLVTKATIPTTPLETITETLSSTNSHTHFSSCLDSNARGNRLAAKTTTPQNICWTGALTRAPLNSSENRNSGNSGHFSDPGTFLCSGALISPTVLVTTATCVSRLFGQDLGQFRVVLGSRRLLHPSVGWSDGFYREVEELVIHEEYGVYGGVVRVNDVAIVKLSPPTPNESFCTVCLPATSNYSMETCIVSGFSHPTSNAAGIGEPSSLHEAEQLIEPPKICSAALANYSKKNLNTNLFRTEMDEEEAGLICASGRSQAEACFSPRDAGSPLACPSPTGYRLVGLFSSGFHCGTRQMPVLYTNLASGRLGEWVGRFL